MEQFTNDELILLSKLLNDVLLDLEDINTEIANEQVKSISLYYRK